MRIAINTRFLLNHKMEGFGWYTYEIVKRLVANHPEVDFIFFFDRKYDERFIFGKNVTPVVLNPPARHPVLFYLWYEYSVKRALKKHNADLFFSPDGYLSLKSTVKQINVIHDINFEHNPKDVPRRIGNYLQHYFPKFARKADQIITVSEYSKNDICKTYSIPQEKVTVSWNGASDLFQPISDNEKLKIEQQYANGNPYFLFVGALHPRKNVDRLIEAFSIMKTNEPNNNYKLVIVGEELFSKHINLNAISDTIRKEIYFTGHLSVEALAKLMAGAAVFTFVPYFEGFGIPLVEAMKCGTPIVAGNRTSLPEVAGDAALYCDPFNVPDIADKLSLISNNDSLRQELSAKGLERSRLFSWDRSAEKVWEVITHVASR
jgi:glycosyltransferase involved in cell wall biosynthesis